MFLSLIMVLLHLVLFANASRNNNNHKVLYKSAFRMDNENWQITGNRKMEPAVHQTYTIDPDISHYIMFKDNLMNPDYKTRNDNSLWFFESPKITMNPSPKEGTISVRGAQCPSQLSFTLTSFAGDFAVANANTNTHLVAIRNEDKCITFQAPHFDGKTRTFVIPLSNPLLWKKERTHETITEDEMTAMFLGPFTLEILGDWTRGYEVIGLDNVMIVS